MDLEENYIPPPAYSEQEFDQKTSRATELSLELAKREASKFDLDEEGFPRYDPVMFEEVSRAQKGKDQLTPTTFRSQSITKRPLPNPKSFQSSSAAGPSTLRQTAPLHISKKSITKVEEAARDASDITASSHSRTSTPSQMVKDTLQDNPPYGSSVLTADLPSVPIRSSRTTPEENPFPVENTSTHTLSSFPNHQIDAAEANIPYTARNLPGFSQPSTTEIQEDNPPYAPSRTLTPNQRIEPIPDNNSSYSERNHFVSDHISQSISDSNFEDAPRDNPPYQLNYSAQPPHHEQYLESWEEDGAISRQEATSELVPDDRFGRSRSEVPQQPTRSRELLTPANRRRLDVQPRYTTAPNFSHPPSPQHFSLPPVPRSLPRINTSDRARSHSEIPSVHLLQPSGNAPRVVFNPDVAYGRNPTGGPLPQFHPKEMSQAQFQAHFNPHMLYK